MSAPSEPELELGGSGTHAFPEDVQPKVKEPLDFEGCGPFVLGMPVGAAIAFLRKHFRTIGNVELKYSDANPTALALVINLTEDGIQLRFDPTSQRLRMIEVYDLGKTMLSYCGTRFCDGATEATFVSVYRLFGPSHPGDYDPVRQQYCLNYPGLTFIFPIPSKHESLYSKGDAELPLEFPDGTTPIASRLCLYAGGTVRDPQLPPQGPNDFNFEEVRVDVNTGLYFTKRRRAVTFGDSCQDVITELGPPSKIFYKDEDKMRIHAHAGAPDDARCSDYFYNYFELGVDVLFDGARHVAKKFVLHTNSPGHFDFNRYAKCNFRILRSACGEAEAVAEPSPPPQERLVDVPAPAIARRPLARDALASAATADDGLGFVVTPDTKWDEILGNFGKPIGKPVVFKRGSSSNPFGATFFYGYKQIIFEVMRNNHIASVTIFLDAEGG